MAEATTALDQGRVGAARAAAAASVSLARGELLPDDEGEWVEADRAAAGALVGAARRVEAEAAARAGDHLAAIAGAEGALAHDPHDERALRLLMASHAAAGRAASALAAFARVRERLVDDLGVSPSAETEALHEEILLRPETRVRFELATETRLAPGTGVGDGSPRRRVGARARPGRASHEHRLRRRDGRHRQIALRRALGRDGRSRGDGARREV